MEKFRFFAFIFGNAIYLFKPFLYLAHNLNFQNAFWTMMSKNTSAELHTNVNRLEKETQLSSNNDKKENFQTNQV